MSAQAFRLDLRTFLSYDAICSVCTYSPNVHQLGAVHQLFSLRLPAVTTRTEACLMS